MIFKGQMAAGLNYQTGLTVGNLDEQGSNRPQMDPKCPQPPKYHLSLSAPVIPCEWITEAEFMHEYWLWTWRQLYPLSVMCLISF